MTISRSTVANYLHSRFSRFADDVGQADTDDSPQGYGVDIDDALRDLDTSESDLATATVADANRRGYFALAEYYTARRMWLQVSSNPNTKSGDQAVDYSKVVDALKAIMDSASAIAAAEGIGPDTGQWGRASLLTDYLEPDPCV